MAQLLIRGGLVHDAIHETPFIADILCENGKIAAIGENLTAADGCEVIDAAGKNVYPGFVEAHGHIVVHQLLVLVGYDATDGVSQPEPDHEQGRATRNAHDRHEEPALVAQQIAGSDFLREREPLPQRSNMLEEDTLARLGNTRQHKRRRTLAQARRRRRPRCNCRDSD